ISNAEKAEKVKPGIAETKAIAEEGFIYGLPIVMNYAVMYEYVVVTTGALGIRFRECHIYQVPILVELRNQTDEFDIRIEVTLSYVAQPWRTRRNLRRYLSTWVDWKSNKLGEGLDHFRARAMRE